MKDKKNSYIGRIQNRGSHRVKAPFAGDNKTGKTKVKTGDDLRTGNK